MLEKGQGLYLQEKRRQAAQAVEPLQPRPSTSPAAPRLHIWTSCLTSRSLKHGRRDRACEVPSSVWPALGFNKNEQLSLLSETLGVRGEAAWSPASLQTLAPPLGRGSNAR